MEGLGKVLPPCGQKICFRFIVGVVCGALGAVMVLFSFFSPPSALISPGQYKGIVTMGRQDISSPAPPYPTLPEKRHLLLVTYGRSGSSFTSALISVHPEVFYAFEPLYSLEGRHHLTDSELFNLSSDTLTSYFTCEFKDFGVLKNMHLKSSEDTVDVFQCVKNKKPQLCLLKLITNCRAGNTAFIKTIRFRVKWAEQFLQNNPNFKLLYLVRDPRAILYSQARVFRNFHWPKNVSHQARAQCRMMADDVSHVQRLRQLYPHRVKAIRYEDGATNPLAYTKAIYAFAGLRISEAVIEYARNITAGSVAAKSSLQTNKNYQVVKLDSKAAMEKWRRMAGYKPIRLVDQICGHLYPALGYSPVRSQKDLVSNRSLVLATGPGGLL